jgi:hypothetical protein
MTDEADVTGLLLAWSDGDQAAGNRLIDALYPELRRVPSGISAGSATTTPWRRRHSCTRRI